MKKIGILSLVLLLSIALPLFSEEGFSSIFDTPIEVQEDSNSINVIGKISTGMSYFPSLDHEIGAIASFTGELQFTHPTLEGIVGLSTPPFFGQTISYEQIIDTLSLTYFLSKGNIQVGYLIHPWGVSDTYKVVDLLNAPTYSHGFSMDVREMKQQEMMVISQMFIDDLSIEMVYKPLFTPISFGNDGDKWSTTIEDESIIINENTTYSAQETNTFSYGSFATNLSFPLGPVDSHLIYYNGYYYQQGMTFTFSPPVGTDPRPIVQDIETIYTHMNIIGVDSTLVKGPFTFAVEGALFLSEDSKGIDPSLFNSRIEYSTSLTYMIGGGSNSITVGYNGWHILDYNGANPLDVDTSTYSENDHNIIVGLHLTLLKEKLVVEGGLTYQIPTKGYALLSKIEYFLQDDITFTLESTIIGSLDDNIFSIYRSWEANDQLSLSLSYQF